MLADADRGRRLKDLANPPTLTRALSTHSSGIWSTTPARCTITSMPSSTGARPVRQCRPGGFEPPGRRAGSGRRGRRPAHVGMRGEHLRRGAAHESGCARDRNEGTSIDLSVADPLILNFEAATTSPALPDTRQPSLFGRSPSRSHLGLLHLSGFDFRQIDLAQVMRMLQSPGPVNWEIARQTAEWVALEGRPEPTVDPRDGAQFDELAARRRPSSSGRPGLRPRSPPPSARSGAKGWVDLHLAALRPGARGPRDHAR